MSRGIKYVISGAVSGGLLGLALSVPVNNYLNGDKIEEKCIEIRRLEKDAAYFERYTRLNREIHDLVLPSRLTLGLSFSLFGAVAGGSFYCIKRTGENIVNTGSAYWFKLIFSDHDHK